jgi:UDP-glucuronate 4-epimerase
MTILITGAAGFIGFHTAQKLLGNGHEIVGLDNLNEYYSIKLKQNRINILEHHKNFSFVNGDIVDVASLIRGKKVTHVIHLAAQAGVRYSLENPMAYVHSNLVGQTAILEFCRHLDKLEVLISASSSSVYGAETKLPYSIDMNADKPVSLYAATKRSAELLNYSYTQCYGYPITNLRFFTVYGAWGRPDMAYYKFAESILDDKEIEIYNHGNQIRDFTYIDDIVSGILACMGRPNIRRYKTYNLGNNNPVKLMDFLSVLENTLGKKAKYKMLDAQKGDVAATYADIKESKKDLFFSPKTSLEQGLPVFADWLLKYRAGAV